MSSLATIQHSAIRRALGNRVLSKPGLAVDGVNMDSAAAIVYTIDGVTYSKAQLADQDMAVTHDCFAKPITAVNLAYEQPISTTVFYVMAINANGDIAIVQGDYAGQVIADEVDLSRVNEGTGAIPPEPEGYTAFGLVKVATNSSATFTPGTTSMAASGVTTTVYDVSMLPASM